jgi:transposase InsO family protein
MPVSKKLEIVTLVNRSPIPKCETLRELGMARSTFYRGQKRYRAQGEAGLVDRRPDPGSVWNRLRPAEQESILAEALQQPDLSPRELAFYISDHRGFAVSESSVYRVLKRHGLVREVKLQGFPAGKEYRVKTTRINEQWQSDASYFFVVSWGWYYLISVLDDFSRMILAWDLMMDMTAESIGEIVEQAVAFTGMRDVPVEDKTKLLTDNGPGYIAKVLEDYLRMQSIHHIRCSPHHPQTNGKLERFHQTLKTRLNVLVYSSPEALQRAMAEFIAYYNQQRYHEGIGNVAPADVYYGRREDILRRREEQKELTIQTRLRYNLGRREPQPEDGSTLETVACR